MVLLSHPIPNRSSIGLYTSSDVSAEGAELARTLPLGDFEGQELLAFVAVIVGVQAC